MSDPGAGPSNISSQRYPRTRPNVFELFNPDESDSDDDFKIPHIISDESGSSSRESVDGEISDAFGWKKVDQEQERYGSRTTDPTFIPRHSKTQI